MTDKTLPASVRIKALRAIATIHAWNAVVHQARRDDALDGRIGRLEYRVMTDTEHIPMRLAMGNGLHLLDTLEQTYRAQGWSPAQFYAALGTERPAVVPEGPKVVTWREGVR